MNKQTDDSPYANQDDRKEVAKIIRKRLDEARLHLNTARNYALDNNNLIDSVDRDTIITNAEGALSYLNELSPHFELFYMARQ